MDSIVSIKIILFSILGGLALFLLGLKLLSEGLQMAFGDRLKSLLEKITKNKLQGLGVGTLVTMIVQSSSVTTVTLVGLINAGVLTLTQAVPVIMGANIGTTITAQLIAFQVGKYSLPIIAFGVLLNFTAKTERWKYLGQVLLGFGILFLGMTLMSSEIKVLAKDSRTIEVLANFGKTHLLAILAAAIFTEIIQSSSATTGLVITMGMGGLINLETAICFILGANIGTTITVVLAAFFSPDSSISSKRAAIAHVMFNIIGVLLFFPLISSYTQLLAKSSDELSRQIANAHMSFNLIIALVLLPLSGYLIKIVKLLIPGEETSIEKGTKFLDDHVLDTPAVALTMAEKEILRMIDVTASMLSCSRKALFENSPRDIALVKENEKLVDELDDKIEVFISKISREALSKRQQAHLSVLLHAISDIERVADHANNISELAELKINKKIDLSEAAMEELLIVFDKADASLELCRKIIAEDRPDIIKQILSFEKEVDKLVAEFEANHIMRLEQNQCQPEAGPVFVDILRNLERITDHTHNVAYAKRFGF
jgi:phosphate:Na+ symporter